MRYVGYSRGFHDGGLAIIEEDGTVSYASNSERYTKIKYDPMLAPELESMIKNDDYVVYFQDIQKNAKKWEWSPMTVHRSLSAFTFNSKDEIGKSLKFRRDNREFSLEEIIFNTMEDSCLPFHMHHESHVAGALFTRPWKSREDTVMVSIDGVGEEQSVVIYDSNFNVKLEHCAPQSIGYLYGLTTNLLGYKRLEEEYIVMGMSAFGNPNDDVVNLLKEYYNSFDSFTQEEQRIMRQTFNKVVWEGFRFSVKEEERVAQHMTVPGTPDMTYDLVKDFFVNYKRLISKISDYDTAASIQKFTEDKISELMVHARQYGSKLVYSGGVAQNIVANSKIRDLFDDVHIAIAPSDGGSALGCASKSWSEQTGGTHLKWSPYLGYNIKKDINPKKVVDYLMKNKVCGVANGRAEYGQRALGNRSLLGDIRYDIKDTINKIKQRELFRPFAPAILEEYADEYFDGHKNEYMQYTCNAKHDYKSVIHVDGTSRCQVVKKDCQSVIRPILEEYFERTGIPMLLNTSLNIKGQPMLNDENDVKDWEQKYKVRIF